MVLDNAKVVLGNAEVFLGYSKVVLGCTKVVLGNPKVVLEVIPKLDLCADPILDWSWSRNECIPRDTSGPLSPTESNTFGPKVVQNRVKNRVQNRPWGRNLKIIPLK